MKRSIKLLSLLLIVVPAAPAVAAVVTDPAKPAPMTVTRYSFDKGVSATGVIAENTGRGAPLRVRTVAGGELRVKGTTTARYVGFPAPCDAKATSCPRVILEGTDDPDLDPGTRQFRYGASVLIPKSLVTNSSNVMQKGVVSTKSQWKLQIGKTSGRAQCVVVGHEVTPKAYLVRSQVTVADGRWHKLMCLRTPNALFVFVDGHNEGRIALPATLDISNDLPLRIGGPNLNPASDAYSGYLDDAYVVLG